MNHKGFSESWGQDQEHTCLKIVNAEVDGDWGCEGWWRLRL